MMLAKPGIVACASGQVMLVEKHGRLILPDDTGLTISVPDAAGLFATLPDGTGHTMTVADDIDIFRFQDYAAMPAEYAEWEGKEVRLMNLRESWPRMDAVQYQAAVKGMELVNWAKGERFCAACGAKLRRHSEISKICPACGKEYFPRLNPAIVVLVKRGEEALLVHARTLKGNVHALVAGFVETGESLEECVRREVKEETALEIDEIRYLGSQAWPYPFQLMMGFTAAYKSGTLRFADGELTSGGFFTRQNPPVLPSPPSLTRRIIDCWVAGEL